MRIFSVIFISLLSLKSNGIYGQNLLDRFLTIVTGVEIFRTTTFLNDCSGYKGFLGLNYEQFVANNNNMPSLKDVKIGLRVKNVTYEYSLETSASAILSSPHFNKSLPTAFYVLSHLSFNMTPNVVIMLDALERRGGYNVMYVDGSPVILLFYLWATACTRFIGNELGRQMALFVKGGLNPRNIHCYGLSLAAHICAYAGQNFRNITGRQIGRITAFDAAGPCYFNVKHDERLSPDDAEFVDAIHTNAGWFGIVKEVGHVDFYVNGGSIQPRSYQYIFENHIRSWMYFNESLVRGNEYNFMAVKCPNWRSFESGKCRKNEKTYMGIMTPWSARGRFYLRTNEYGIYPHALKDDGIIPKKDPYGAFNTWLLDEGVRINEV